MRTIFHVGHAKTGSTALQAALSASRRALSTRGVLYPRNPNGLYNNHRLVFADLFEPHKVPRHILKNYRREELPAARDEIVAAIREQVASERPDCLVLSSESRFGIWKDAPRDAFKRTLDSLGARDVEIAAYVRRPSSWYLSALQQAFRASHLVKQPHILRLEQPLRQFAQDFGRARVHVRPYDRRALIDGDIVADFVETFLVPYGVARGDIAAPANANVSLSAEGFDLVRRYRLAFHADAPDTFLPDSQALNAAVGGVERGLDLPRPTLDPDLAERIDYGRADLLKLRDAHGLVLPGYDYARLERGDLTTLPEGPLPLERIVRIDRAAQMRVLDGVRRTSWAQEDARRARWAAEAAVEIERAAEAQARPERRSTEPAAARAR